MFLILNRETQQVNCQQVYHVVFQGLRGSLHAHFWKLLFCFCVDCWALKFLIVKSGDLHPRGLWGARQYLKGTVPPCSTAYDFCAIRTPKYAQEQN